MQVACGRDTKTVIIRVRLKSSDIDNTNWEALAANRWKCVERSCYSIVEQYTAPGNWMKFDRVCVVTQADRHRLHVTRMMLHSVLLKTLIGDSS